MNENEVERLLKSYGDSFDPCSRPEVKMRPVRWNRRAALGLACATVIPLACIGLWPRNAVAGTVARINEALNDVKTMECVTSMKLPSGWHPFLRVFYANEMWRYDSQIGTHLETDTVLRGGQQLVDCKQDSFVTLEKARPEALSDLAKGNESALDFAKKGVDFGQTDVPSTAAIVQHGPVNGRPTYVLSFVRAKDKYRAEILVDEETNLPIQSDMEVADGRPKFAGDMQVIHTDFAFNKPVDAHLFALDSTKTIINPDAAAEQLARQWSRSLGSVLSADIRDASVTPDGTIWIATTALQDQSGTVLPTFLSDERGTQYVRLDDLEPSQMFDHPQFDRVLGKSVFVVGFVPLSPGASLPDQLTVGFAAREDAATARCLKHDLDGKDLKKSVSITPRVESGALPGYFSLLCVRSRYLQLGQKIWSARAHAFEAQNDLLEAAKSYEEWAKARLQWVKYSAFEPLLEAARCYRAIGQAARADDLTRQAEALKASKER